MKRLASDSVSPGDWVPSEEESSPRAAGQSRAWSIYGRLRSLTLTGAAVVGVFCALVFGASFLLGVRPLVVVSGSMEPTIPVGAVVLSMQKPASQIQPGTIVTVQRPRGLGLITHRLVKSVEVSPGDYDFTLKGDANRSVDPESYRVEKVGEYFWHINGLGYVALAIQSPGGLFLVGGAVLLFFALFIVDSEKMAPSVPKATPAQKS